MKEKLLELRQMIYNRLPARWGLRSKVQQITNTVSEVYEFKLEGINPDHYDLKNIRMIILLHPYTVSTKPIQIRIAKNENDIPDLYIVFTVLNKKHGKQIEHSIRLKFNLPDGNN